MGVVLSDASLVGFVIIRLYCLSILLLWYKYVLALCVVGVDRRATTGSQVEEGRDPEETHGLLPVHTDHVGGVVEELLYFEIQESKWWMKYLCN